MKLYDHQIEQSKLALEKLRKYKLVYLNFEVRTGKTGTALNTAKLYGAKKVLFLTKKKAISSIENDYNNFGFNNFFDLDVVNYESMHKRNDRYHLIIVDEVHSFGAFPKPSQRTKNLKAKAKGLPMIFLSGTITPESFSQIYHQFWISSYSPFPEKNFYQWAKTYVNITKKYVAHGNQVNDYSDGKEKEIMQVVNPYILRLTQKEANIVNNLTETILEVKAPKIVKNVFNKLKKDSVVEGKEKTILANSGASLSQKLHQIASGSILADFDNNLNEIESYSDRLIILSNFKAEFIKDTFKDKKIAIFYVFKGEFEILKSVFKENLTTEIDEFNDTDKNIALQIRSGREGTNLSKADALVMFNIDYSALSYWQGRDRMVVKGRKQNNIYWIFSDIGFEREVFKAVNEKKDFTIKHFTTWSRNYKAN